MDERILQYIWEHRLYREAEWLTTDGERLEVISPGVHNLDAGPDFFNAQLRIAGNLWAGDVEIHLRASDWRRHGHDRNPAYNSVILHVVSISDDIILRPNGRPIPQIILRIPDPVMRSIDWLLSRDQPTPCLSRLDDIDPFRLTCWKASLLSERLERKTIDIIRRLDRTHDDWNETFYITLTRNFGFGTNSDAFEWLATSLPSKCIRRQSHSLLQIEALLFGQAGMLSCAPMDDYHRNLQREHAFLRQKYNLPPPVGDHLFKQFRTRPINFPHLRLAQLAAIWAQHDALFSRILEPDATVDRLLQCFRASPSDYWATHYHFGGPAPIHKTTIGLDSARGLLINTVVPILFTYGKRRQRPELCERALQLLDDLPPERNAIVRAFTTAGLTANNAADTQAFIQLRREYCDKRRCLSCRIGFGLLKKVVVDSPIPSR